ncbi:MAG: AFG3 family protein [Sphingobacteriales bacterium]|jgi:AFG3 family protein
MKNQPNKKSTPNNKPKGKGGKLKAPTPKFNFYWIYGIIFVAFLGLNLLYSGGNTKEITYQRFKTEMLENNDVEKLITYKKADLYYVEVFIKKDKLGDEKYKEINQPESMFANNNGPHYFFTEGSVETLEKKLQVAQADFPQEDRVDLRYVTRNDWFGDALGWIIPILLMIGIWIFLMRRMGGAGGGPGGQIFNIGKSKATLFDKDTQVNITFNDVAGLEEAKIEVYEVVDFLKNPKKYTNLGGKIPKGVLLVGSPGTGKTLLAKAVAGEAQVPFFSISGSEFVEMFVGVGASRVRDLFKQAREKAPCIIFIDEIDAIGRSRGKNQIAGGNDERENTLNQLLVEMDGFGTDTGVIIMAATNRPDVLDSALLRPGRFDRQVGIDKPDLAGREAIFKVHLKSIKTSESVGADKLSAQTPGFAGAEIANVCNEAALIAARKDKKHVEMIDFQDAVDRVIGGLEKKNKIISPDEKRIVAYHEAGHAIAGWFLEHADPLVKVSIVPRGLAALGYAQYLPKEQYLYTTEQLTDGMCMTMGGRVAEDIIFGRISTGAQNDLERITKLAYAMVTVYGMSEKVGNLSFNDNDNEYRMSKPYSEKTAELIDQEVRILVKNIYNQTKELLLERREELEKIAQALLAKEILFQADLEELIGKRPYEVQHAIQAEETKKEEAAIEKAKEEEAIVEEKLIEDASAEAKTDKPEDTDTKEEISEKAN